MKKNLSIDVLICVHSPSDKHDKLLQRALESLARQSYDDFWTIVVLDECQPETKSIVEAYEDVLNLQIYERPRKMGLAYAKNYGLSKCTGDWIMYLDADDAYHEDKIKLQVEFIEKNSQYDIIGMQAYDVYDVGTENEKITENCFALGQYEIHEQIVHRLPFENIICHDSVAIKRKVLQELGGYNTSLAARGQEDYILWKLAASKGYQFYNIPFRGIFYSMGTSVER